LVFQLELFSSSVKWVADDVPMTDYYQKHYAAYHEKTFVIDPSSFLEPLERRLFPGCRILDIGCGSGRDMLWFKNRGFEVTGIERSPGLAELARRDTGCSVIESDFQDYEFSKLKTDAVLLVASLVHVPHENFKAVFRRVTSGLEKGGKVLVTLKQGEGIASDENGRVFYLWQDESLRPIFIGLEFVALDFFRQASKVNANDTWLSYVLEKSSPLQQK
jgi:SAM-dependent methyltransferase